MKQLTLLLALVVPFCIAHTQESWNPDQQQIIEAMKTLSASTAPDGAGADAYGASLASNFSRWTVGSTTISARNEWVEGIREWFDDGWRVSDRKVQHLEITVMNDLAFTRRIVRETYLGPQGDRSDATAAVAEVWTREKGRWLLLRANVHPMPNP